MIFKILTLFPEFFDSPLNTGLQAKAQNSGLFSVDPVNIRSYTDDNYHRCDDYPYGGGSGMVLKPGPLMKALEDMDSDFPVLLTSPSGKLFTQDMAKKLSAEDKICIICGHYEGIDQRVIDRYVDYEISIGDYVLSGGEFAALVIINAITRLLPGFMSNADSLTEESFEGDLFEYPHYTRPGEIEGISVPGVLLSGNHSEISKWRTRAMIEKTKRIRPDLYKKFLLRKIRGE